MLKSDNEFALGNATLKKRPTLWDVARLAGVTDGTVSRALSGDKRVQEETRRKVVEAARKLNYVPNLQARFFKEGKTHNLGVFCETGTWIFYNPYFGKILTGLAEAADLEKTRLVFYFPDLSESIREQKSQELLPLAGMDELKDGRVDGAIIFSAMGLSNENIEKLQKGTLPLVLLNTARVIPGFFQLYSGAAERTAAAVHRLLELGHRNIAFTGLQNTGSFNEVCLEAIRREYGRKGFEWDSRFFEASPVHELANPEWLKNCFFRWYSKGATAFVCADVVQVSLLLEISKGLGLRTPRDFSLVGFGDLPEVYRVASPVPSLMEADLFEAGRQTFRLFREAQKNMPGRVSEIAWRWGTQGQTLGPLPTSKVFLSPAS